MQQGDLVTHVCPGCQRTITSPYVTGAVVACPCGMIYGLDLQIVARVHGEIRPPTDDLPPPAIESLVVHDHRVPETLTAGDRRFLHSLHINPEG